MNLSEIGLGTWNFGGGGWKYGLGPMEEDVCHNILSKVVENNINWIDTAPLYGLGLSEKRIGRWIKKNPDKLKISTKCGLRWNEKNKLNPCLEPESIVEELKNSLNRLKVKKVDVLLIHYLFDEKNLVSGWQTLLDLRDKNKVGFCGLSNPSLEHLISLSKIEKPWCVQIPLNFFCLKDNMDIISYCRQNNIHIHGYSPLAKGVFSCKTVDYWLKLPLSDHRRKDLFFNPDLLRVLAPLFELLSDAEGAKNISKNTLTVLKHCFPDVKFLCGYKNIKQVNDFFGKNTFILEEKIKKIFDFIDNLSLPSIWKP